MRKVLAGFGSAALLVGLSGIPAEAATDMAVNTTLGNQTVADDSSSIPGNPTQSLPSRVSSSIPDSATVVAKNLAVTTTGQVKNLQTGANVTDPRLVGTVNKPADPLAKTDGRSFIPVSVATVKKAVSESQGGSVTNSSETSAHTTVRSASFSGNEYGAYWGTYSGTPAFFESDGTLFAQQAKGVIDVSQWQGSIDWAKAKADGVQGAIIRVSFGWGNGFDPYALRNISECKRLGIPFGVYSYSYSYDSATAALEGADLASLLKQAGVSPSDLSYPVFYDLENWTWTGHTRPSSPSVYDGIVNSWYSKLQAAGYTNLSVYSYSSYLSTALNSSNIHSKTRWVASYGSRTGFSYPTNDRGWQYTSDGSINGISGSVDLNAFGNKTFVAPSQQGITVYRVYNPNTGEHFFTTNQYEYTSLAAVGWSPEGVAWIAPSSGQPVYRLYSSSQGFHLYTVNGNEYTMLTQYGWKQEGICWFSGGAVPIYRVYNPNSGQHLFTVNANERNNLVQLGWHDEGVGWYATSY
ncbi:MAG: GH25 family lysozyme [Bifidobacterium sp.]|jgi:lysozyme